MIKVDITPMIERSVDDYWVDERQYTDEVEYAEDILDKVVWAEINGHKVEHGELGDKHEYFDIPDYNVHISVYRD